MSEADSAEYTVATPRWMSREEAVYWFDEAAWIARARVRLPSGYSDHAEDYVDTLCHVYQNFAEADWTGPSESTDDADTNAEKDRTEQQKLVTDGGGTTAAVDRFECDHCGRKVTRGGSGTEYGHERGRGDTGRTDRCPQRPDDVDPSGGVDHDGWVLPGGETEQRRGGEAD